MKKLFSLALVLVMVFAFCACGEKPEPEPVESGSIAFRGVEFGMSFDEVRDIEEGTPSYEEESNGLLWYDGVEIASVEGNIKYYFADDKLSSINFTSVSSDIYMDDYKALKEYLSEIYGNPSLNTEFTVMWSKHNVSMFSNDAEHSVNFTILG